MSRFLQLGNALRRAVGAESVTDRSDMRTVNRNFRVLASRDDFTQVKVQTVVGSWTRDHHSVTDSSWCSWLAMRWSCTTALTTHTDITNNIEGVLDLIVAMSEGRAD